MSSFKDRTGAIVLPVVDADGNVPVALADDAAASVPELLERLCWEVAELRRVMCESTGEFFNKYPGASDAES